MNWGKGIFGTCMIAASVAACLFFWPLAPFFLDATVERALIGAVIGVIIVVIVMILLSVQEKKQRREAYDEQMRLRRQSKIKVKKASPSFAEHHDDLSRVFDQMKALPNMPRVFERLKTYWGFPEFLEVADDMLTMEAGREGRQGFDPAIHQEVSALRHFYIENIEKIMSPSLTEEERNRIRERIRKYA